MCICWWVNCTVEWCSLTSFMNWKVTERRPLSRNFSSISAFRPELLRKPMRTTEHFFFVGQTVELVTSHVWRRRVRPFYNMVEIYCQKWVWKLLHDNQALLAFTGGADKSLDRPDWKNNWKVAIFRPTRRSILPRTHGWTDNLLHIFWLACKS